MNKINVKMNKPVYIGLSILDISKIAMYKYWHDYVKSNHGEMPKLCYMDTGSLIVHVKLGDIYAGFSGNVKKTFGLFSYKVEKQLLIGKKQNKIGLIKDELCGEIMKGFAALGPKAHRPLTD